jgi:hypothetical protein
MPVAADGAKAARPSPDQPGTHHAWQIVPEVGSKGRAEWRYIMVVSGHDDFAVIAQARTALGYVATIIRGCMIA